MNNYVLMVFELHGEETLYYLIPQEEADEQLFEDCNGHLGDVYDLSDKQKENLKKLNLDLSHGYCISPDWGDESEYTFKYNKYEVKISTDEKPIKLKGGDVIVAVYNCGISI
jgi:SAM-dependent MidA family methyltransferase